MPFFDQEKHYGPLALPDHVDISPREALETDLWGETGAAFRQYNPVTSFVRSINPYAGEPFDPDYSPWQDIQGTDYEQYADRFVGARNKEDMARIRMLIDQEHEDRLTLDSAGFRGMLLEMGASVLSPTSFLPGGAIVKGKEGISIAKTGLSVSMWAGGAALADEMMLHASQETRGLDESAFNIGGSVILGGILGSGIAKLTQKQVQVASERAVETVKAAYEFNEGLRSIGAAEVTTDFTVRNEKLFQAIKSVPFFGKLVETDPVLRTTLAPIKSVRAAAAGMVETPLQYQVNEAGQSVRRGEGSVEGRIKERERNALAGALGHLHRAYGEYWKDGPVGVIGTLTAPLQRNTANLAGATEKLSPGDFMEEVGKAMRGSDKHPIPQVQRAAEQLRRDIFDPILDEATELGIFDPDLKLKNGASYFTRAYKTELIAAHWGDGTEMDMSLALKKGFSEKRAAAEQRLVNDKTVEQIEAEVFRAKETVQGAQRALKKITKKTKEKRDRATAAVKREGAVGRSSAALRKLFTKRSDDLSEKLVEGDELEALKEGLRLARGATGIRPVSLHEAVRNAGGIQDPRTGGIFGGASGWTKDAPRTELEELIDRPGVSSSLRRRDGKAPDYLRALLLDEGYPVGETVEEFIDAVARSANGEEIFSELDAIDAEMFRAAIELQEAFDEMGIDWKQPIDKIIPKLEGKARNQATTKAKSKEAARSGKTVGKTEAAASKRAIKALERLDEANARLKEIEEVISPKVKEEIKGAREQLRDLSPKLAKAKKARSTDEFFAETSDEGIDAAVKDAIGSIVGLKPGQHSYHASLSSPTRARTLDVADELLEPWLESNAEVVMSQYFRSMVPEMEIIRTFGDLDLTEAKFKINEEAKDLATKVTGQRAKKRILQEAEDRKRDLDGMRDRLRGTYGVPDNPRNIFTQGGRTLRTVSYMGYLGGMQLSAMPDVGGVIGRAGIKAVGQAAFTAVTDPKRMFKASKDMFDIGASAEWYMNGRAMALGEMFDPHGQGTALERTLAQGARTFSMATGMIPWNTGWKSVGGAMVASRMMKAADAVRAGKATKDQMLKLAENDIEPWMAERISKQVEQYGDKDGSLWLAQARLWDDQEAVHAFRRAMNREFDLMVITPGQDLPLAFGTEAGKFFLQFKSFGFSAYHRILLSGIQRADANVLGQFILMFTLGALVSNIKADMLGYDRKEGTALIEDALDRSGLAGWLMEPYNAVSAMSGGKLSISGEPVSRFQSRSYAQGLLGPSVDMVAGMSEGLSGLNSDSPSHRDVRKLMRPIPGNNLPYMLGLFQKLEDAGADAFGAPRREP